MANPVDGFQAPDHGWNGLVRFGGVAALLAGAIFRRNLGVEISVFSAQKPPGTVVEWFALLQSNRLLALSYLNLFDLVNYGLVALMFLALYVALRRTSRSQMAVAISLGFLGIAVYFASNTALSMLSLSDQYTTETMEAQRTLLQAAGQAMLAMNRFSSPGAHPGAGGYLSLLLIASAGLITSFVMIRSNLFSRWTAYIGLLASLLDLAYCIAYAFLPGVGGGQLALLFIPAAGLLLMIWHILIGLRLYQLGRLGST